MHELAIGDGKVSLSACSNRLKECMQRNFKLAAQKASLTKQRLTRNLYMSRGMFDMDVPSANVLVGRSSSRHNNSGGSSVRQVSTGKSGLRISTGSAFSASACSSDMPSLSTSSAVLNESRGAKKRLMRVNMPKGGLFLLDETPSPRISQVEPKPMEIG